MNDEILKDLSIETAKNEQNNSNLPEQFKNMIQKDFD